MLRKNVAGQFIYFAGIDDTTGGVLTGATFSVRRSIDGTFAAGGGTITEDTGLGFYKCALTQADTNGNDLAFFFTASGAIPVCINVLTTAGDPSSATNGGLTNLDAAITSRMATYTQPTGFLAATFPGTVASTTNITAGTITTVTTLTNLPAITAGWLTAAGIAAGALDGKGNWNIGKTGYSLTATTGLGNQTANITGNLSGSVGSVTGLTAANLDVAVSTRMATYTQPTGFLAATFPGTVASTTNITAGTITTCTNLTNAPTAGDLTATMKTSVETAVWDATAASHSTAGTTGKALIDAGAAGNPWSADTASNTGAGTFGLALGTTLQTSLGALPTATQNADALLNRDMSAVSDTNARSPLNALRFLRNKWSVAAGTLTVTKENDTTAAWTAAVTTDAAAEPIIGNDPA